MAGIFVSRPLLSLKPVVLERAGIEAPHPVAEVIVVDVDVAVRQEALREDQIMGLVAGERLGREDQAGSQEHIDQEGNREKESGPRPLVPPLLPPRSRRDRPRDEGSQEIERAEDGQPGQDRSNVPEEYDELKEDKPEEDERRKTDGDGRSERRGRPARPPGQARAPRETTRARMIKAVSQRRIREKGWRCGSASSQMNPAAAMASATRRTADIIAFPARSGAG